MSGPTVFRGDEMSEVIMKISCPDCLDHIYVEAAVLEPEEMEDVLKQAREWHASIEHNIR